MNRLPVHPNDQTRGSTWSERDGTTAHRALLICSQYLVCSRSATARLLPWHWVLVLVMRMHHCRPASEQKLGPRKAPPACDGSRLDVRAVSSDTAARRGSAAVETEPNVPQLRFRS